MCINTDKSKAATGRRVLKTEYIALALGCVAVIFLPLIFTSRYSINLFILAASMGVSALGLTVSLGYTGLLSMAQAVFFGIGAYAVGLGTTRWELSWWVALLLGFAFTILLLVIIFVWWLKSRHLGRSMRAVRENELAAEALGVDTFRTKVTAFLICALLGALGGSLYASGFLYISPDSFAYSNSVEFLAMVLMGGSESAIGTVMGATLLIFLPELLREFKDIYLVIYGCIIIFVIIFMPEGIWGFVDRFIRRFSKPKTLPLASQPLEVGEASEGEVLVIHQLAKHFGGLKALDGVDFVVRQGELHALIGPNGSGKTTCINVISGIYIPTFGKITFLGRDITGMRPHCIARLGLARTFQNLRLFRELTVWENVLIGSQREGGTEEEIQGRAIAAIEFVGLRERAYERCRNLPYGHQKLVELARTLAGKPRLLLLDEPAAGLNESEKEELAGLINRIHEMGLTIVLVEHDMAIVARLSTQVTVLNFGQKISEGTTEDTLKDPVVIEAYLGNMEVTLDA